MRRISICLLLPLIFASFQGLRAQDASEPMMPREFILLPTGFGGRGGRVPVRVDPIEAQIVAGTWKAPRPGDPVPVADGTSRPAELLPADNDGSVARHSGYALWTVTAPERQVRLLEASGHLMAYVNGEPHAGDPYGYRYCRLPVLLHAGRNTLLFAPGRGRLKARLTVPDSALLLNPGDTTLPDLPAGGKTEGWGAIVVVNASEKPVSRGWITAALAGGDRVRATLPAIPPLSTRKVGFRISGDALRDRAAVKRALTLTLRDDRGDPASSSKQVTLELRVRKPGQTYRRTFLSEIDGSVQYYAVNPQQPEPGSRGSGSRETHAAEGRPLPALFLSLHGAGVEAIGQADAYSGKSWGHLVAPTNRRPFGFDWEDWGRLDALEVLENAMRLLPHDSRRIYLTGHSMGGHGAWHLSVTHPNRFAAVAPSAGWISFSTYAGGSRPAATTTVSELLNRATNGGDTLALAPNLKDLGVYILHGDADDNVPVGQARTMRQALSPFHPNLSYHEQRGAGHWWDASDEPGADCVDWAPMFDFFARHALPEPRSVREVEFATVNPAVSSRYRWAEIISQQRALQVSSIRLRCDPLQRRFVGSTVNVARLALGVDALQVGGPITVELDGTRLTELPWPQPGQAVHLRRGPGGAWMLAGTPDPGEKNPARAGPFKDAFRHRFQLVYGTRGSAEENAWALAKARFDAERFWYQGNAAVDVLPDTEFDPAREPERGVVLYGNARTHAAWNALLAGAAVQVEPGAVRVGEKTLREPGLACLFAVPRPGGKQAMVAVIGGTDLAGMRLTDRAPYFTSGVGYPDVTVLGSDVLTRGIQGVRAAGFLGNDWRVESGEFGWSETRSLP